MTRFVIGLLLGAIVGIAGTAAFLVVYGGADYLVSTSPKLRQLEAELSRSDEDREWLKSRLRDATDVTHRLEARFEALAARFERLGSTGSEPPPPARTAAPTAAVQDGAPIPEAPSPSDAAGAARDDALAEETPSDSLDAIPTIAPAELATPAP
jgi:hypothetical protein